MKPVFFLLIVAIVAARLEATSDHDTSPRAGEGPGSRGGEVMEKRRPVAPFVDENPPSFLRYPPELSRSCRVEWSYQLRDGHFFHRYRTTRWYTTVTASNHASRSNEAHYQVAASRLADRGLLDSLACLEAARRWREHCEREARDEYRGMRIGAALIGMDALAETCTRTSEGRQFRGDGGGEPFFDCVCRDEGTWREPFYHRDFRDT